MIRWVGIFCDYYHWREAVDPRDRRVPMYNLLWAGKLTACEHELSSQNQRHDHRFGEVFGHSVSDKSPAAKKCRSQKLCPFRNDVCNKDSIKDPLGVCSLADLSFF